MFLSNYLNLFASNPVATLVASSILLVLIVSLGLSLLYTVLQGLVSYWSQGEVKRKHTFHAFIARATGTISKVGDRAKGRGDSYILKELSDGKFVWVDSCRDVLNRAGTTYYKLGSGTANRHCLFDTIEEASVLGKKGGLQAHHYYTGIVASLIALTPLSIALDWLIVNQLAILLIVSLFGLVVYIVLAGGRKAYTFNKKLNKLDEVKQDKEETAK